MKIGNWSTTEFGIEWNGQDDNRFVVNQQQLLDTEDNMYKWILLVTEEDWLTDDDLYDFNFAFVYSAASSGADFNYDTFDRTLDEQYGLLDDEDDED